MWTEERTAEGRNETVLEGENEERKEIMRVASHGPQLTKIEKNKTNRNIEIITCTS